MTQRLEFHADHHGFLARELERLAAQPVVWADCYRALADAVRPNRFDPIVERFCEDLEWPPLEGLDLARACARLHFAVWVVDRMPWEVVEHPVSGVDYLKRLLIDQYWLHRQRWIVESWAGVVEDEEEDF